MTFQFTRNVDDLALVLMNKVGEFF